MTALANIAEKEPLWEKVMNADNENDPQQGKSSKAKMWLIKILLAAAWIFWIINAHQRILDLRQVFEIPPGRSLVEHINIIYSQPEQLRMFDIFPENVLTIAFLHDNITLKFSRRILL